MYKKHFNEIAAALAAERAVISTIPDESTRAAALQAFDSTVDVLCRVFRQINPNFDRSRFKAACGLDA